MRRIDPVKTESVAPEARRLLADVKAEWGMIPNLLSTLAKAPAALEAYLNFNKALAHGTLPADLREQIALTVAEANGCDYCLAAHSAIGRTVGLSKDTILDSRRGVSPETKTRVALRFARQVVENRGWVDDQDVSQLAAAGYTDSEVVEIVANVAMNLFSNYLNHVAGTEVDFPEAPALLGA